MANEQQIIDWMEEGWQNGFAECPIGDISAGMDFFVYYGWQSVASDELDAVGYWAVVTDYLGNRTLEEFETRAEMEEHQEQMLEAERKFYLGEDEDAREEDFVWEDAD